MKAAIVTIGDELLIGQVVDTNSVFIGQQLESIGCSVVEKMAIADTFDAIYETMSRYQDKVDIVLFTGGLGPTKDDVTKKTFATYFADDLVLNQKVFDHVKQLMEDYYKRPISEMNIQQAYVPSKCTILFNKVGTAPGMLMRNQQTTYVSLPGVPFEMRYLMTEEVLPFIHKQFKLQAIVHQTVLTTGIGESLLAEKIADWEDSLKVLDIHLSYLPQFGLVRLRLSKTGVDKQQIELEINKKIRELNELIPDYFAGISSADSLLEEVITLLKQQELTIATAESCTGGSIAQQLTSFAGSSAYFKGSAITYATESKVNVLGVQQQTIDAYTVVSEEIACEMAKGAQKLFKSDIAVATTGNAGPLKGEAEAEVGTVCVALVIKDRVISFTFNFGQPREKVIMACVAKVWFLLYKYLKQ